MADGIYVGMAAAAARAEQLDSIADNLANIETPGFKASHPAFQSFLPPRAGTTSDKVATAVVGTGIDMSRGNIMTTDNPLDVVPEGNAFLMVGTESGGSAYTRNGKLTVSPDGLLVASGRPVMGTSGNPIEVPVGTTPLVNERGVVSINQIEVDRLALYQLPDNAVHLGQSLYGPGPGGLVTPADADVGVGVRQIEMGNSTALDATVQMIGAQRQFETAMQAIQTYRRLDDRVIEVGKAR
jgi:flagellar basal-body rod protein FlgF